MIIFLYGPDSYRRIRKKKWYIEMFLEKHGPEGVAFFDGAEPEGYQELERFVKTPALFSSKKLAVIEANNEEWGFLEMLAKMYATDENIYLLISSFGSPKGRSTLVKKPSTAFFFDLLKGKNWYAWIAAEAKERGVVLVGEARRLLAEGYTGDSWRCATELERLSSFKKGKVSEKSLSELGLRAGIDAWPLMRDLSSYDVRRRLYSLELLLAQGEPAAKLFFVAASFGKNPAQCAAHDIAVKSGKFDYEEAITDLALVG